MNTHLEVPSTATLQPSILGQLILARMISNKKSPSRADFIKDLKPLFPASLRCSDAHWGDLVSGTLAELANAGQITDPKRNIQITDKGREVLKTFLETDTLPERKPWTALKKTCLTPLALGRKLEHKKDIDSVSKAEGFMAAMLVKLFGLRIAAYPSLPLALHALAVQHGLKPQKNSPEALRDAFLENWIGGLSNDAVFSKRDSGDPSTLDSANPVISSELGDSLEEFAIAVKRIAKSLRDDVRGEKVLISRIWKQFRSGESHPEMTRQQFDERLLQSNQEQLLTLSRADLIGGLDPAECRDSELKPESGDCFHFVRTDRN